MGATVVHPGRAAGAAARRSEFELARLRGIGSDAAEGALNAGAVVAREQSAAF